MSEKSCLNCAFCFHYNQYPLVQFNGRKCQLHQEVLISPTDFPKSAKSLWNYGIILAQKASDCPDWEIAPNKLKEVA
jgi:hypothetical protein